MDDPELPTQDETRPFRPPQTASFIHSGSLRLDIALGGGGIARGEFIEVCGSEGSGKTTLCQHIVGEAQKLGGLAAFIDADHSLDLAFAKRCGLDPDRLCISEPEYAEQATDILESLAQTGALAVIVLDSIAALPSRKELRIPVGKKATLPTNDLLSRTLRKLRPVIFRNRTTILITDSSEGHPRAVYHELAAGPARLALKLHAAQRLSLQPVELLHSGNTIDGVRIEAHILKNKFAPCSRPIRLDLMYNSGINKIGEIFDLCNQLGIFDHQHSEYYFQGMRLGRGRDEAIHFLERIPSQAATLEQIIHQVLQASQPSSFPGIIPGNQADCTEV
jgi:recombination protein RecA